LAEAFTWKTEKIAMQIPHLGKDSCGELCSGGSRGVPVKHTHLATPLITFFPHNKKKQKQKSTNRNPEVFSS